MVAFQLLPQNPVSSPKPDNIQRVIHPFCMIHSFLKPQCSGLSAHIPYRKFQSGLLPETGRDIQIGILGSLGKSSYSFLDKSWQKTTWTSGNRVSSSSSDVSGSVPGHLQASSLHNCHESEDLLCPGHSLLCFGPQSRGWSGGEGVPVILLWPPCHTSLLL